VYNVYVIIGRWPKHSGECTRTASVRIPVSTSKAQSQHATGPICKETYTWYKLLIKSSLNKHPNSGPNSLIFLWTINQSSTFPSPLCYTSQHQVIPHVPSGLWQPWQSEKPNSKFWWTITSSTVVKNQKWHSVWLTACLSTIRCSSLSRAASEDQHFKHPDKTQAGSRGMQEGALHLLLLGETREVYCSEGSHAGPSRPYGKGRLETR